MTLAPIDIAVVDYGAGNLASLARSLSAAGGCAVIVRPPEALAAARAIVLPGVGHFGATAAMDAGWRRAIRRRLDDGTPLLGICLGLQWLFDGSDEAGDVPGLGVFSGRCFRLTGDVKVPHVGWNTLERTTRPSRLLEGLGPDASVYFTHTFAAPIGAEAVATATHGVTFAAALERGRVWGAQFHPEKSGRTGLRILANFIAMAREAR